jgi:hypothetical protein
VGAYWVSVGTGGCFPQVVDVRLRPDRWGVTVRAELSWRTRRQVRGRVSAERFARFAAEVITLAAAAPDRWPPLGSLVTGGDPWTRYRLPAADGTVAEHHGPFTPVLADWLVDWLDTVAAPRWPGGRPESRPESRPGGWLGRGSISR